MSRRSVRMIDPRKFHRISFVLVAAAFLTGCNLPTDGPSGSGEQVFEPGMTCSVPTALLFDGGPGVDGIPALQNPPLVQALDPRADYLDDGDRVIGIMAGNQAVAIPHNILWWHEIVNLDLDATPPLAVTYCPLTGSSMVFDRTAADGATFGVSGIIFQNNLVLWDRRQPASLWSQMGRAGICGREDGRPLSMLGALETTWAGWKALHPGTLVVSGDLGLGRDYRRYPYGRYEDLDNDGFLFPQPPYDQSRPPKERILGIPSAVGEGGIAFPFLELGAPEAGEATLIETTFEDREIVVFWDTSAQGAMAYLPEASAGPLTFRVENDRILDHQTGSQWRLDGLAVAGPLEGERLPMVQEAYVAFWFAWATFQPDTDIWTR